MKKKMITAIISGMFIMITLASSMTIAEESSSDEDNSGIFSSIIEFEGKTEFNDTLNPGQEKEVEITVKYKLDMGKISYWFFTKRRIGRAIMFGAPYIIKLKELPKAKVTLNITDCPEWCSAELDKSELKFTFDNVFKEETVKLTYSINNTAPALEKSTITIDAEFRYDGNGSLIPTSNSTTISFIPAYSSKLDFEFNESLEIPPLKETIIPINITNLGNGETKVDIKIDGEEPENWNISFDPESVTIPIDEDKNIKLVNLVVTPPKDFEEQILTLKLTPMSTSDEEFDEDEIVGDSYTIEINLTNDGSLKDEKYEIPTLTLLIILIVLILVIVIVAAIRKRMK